jgi:hypothetical protein
MDSPRSSAEDTAAEFAEVCSLWVGGGGMSLQKCNKKLVLLGALNSEIICLRLASWRLSVKTKSRDVVTRIRDKTTTQKC